MTLQLSESLQNGRDTIQNKWMPQETMQEMRHKGKNHNHPHENGADKKATLEITRHS